MLFRSTQFALCVLLLTLCGCGSNSKTGTVSGVVTLDSVPADKATVVFYPPAGGRASFGFTDENGNYEMTYTRNTKGALIGQHKVTISTELEADYQGGASQETRAETMPEKVLDKETTDLTADVKRGSNKIDFNLKSADY